MSKKLRIVFMGTPDFAVETLKQLLAAGKNVVGVITAPDRPAGRGRKLRPSPVKKFAQDANLPILQPKNLKDEAFLSELKALNATLQIVVAFRMLPKSVWAMPEYGTFNLHASLLPQYRGAAPINWAIINQEKITGATTFFIDEKIDTGAIIEKREIPIEEHETAGSLHDKLMTMGAELVLHTVGLIEDGNAYPKAQDVETPLKNAPKLTSENTRIDWNKSAAEVEAFVRGLSPFPVAWTHMKQGNDEPVLIKVYNAGAISKKISDIPGTMEVGKKELLVACGEGSLSITELQLPGKRKMDTASLLNGFQFENDAKLL
ncbi:methionyl-tRNA formyltransferase [Luteirhabdus pelagi]|uniref:methionyl-tRNA formyltransferase n=1 Tax=Luteirhabdus pelagi TaxID=2792783 RepID=UPI0019393505|nr:methionyl-tRNA formyltransferase [Luteirhabdus pelagi]